MLELHQLTGPFSAFLAGLVTSLHCSVMCGPLACYVTSRTDSSGGQAWLASAYHLSRLFSYTFVGALAGGLGLLALDWVNIYQQSLARFFPWALVLFFFLVATRLDQFFPKPNFLNKVIFRAKGKLSQKPPLVAAAGVGFLTPLLPCAPLYAIFTLALMSQSPLQGAEFLLSFGLGTLPLLWLIQLGYQHLNGRLTPARIKLIQRLLALIIFLVLAARLVLFETGENGLFCAVPQ